MVLALVLFGGVLSLFVSIALFNGHCVGDLEVQFSVLFCRWIL